MNDKHNNLIKAYGWNAHWQNVLSEQSTHLQHYSPARVIAQHSKMYRIITPNGEHTAAVTGKMAYSAASIADYPAVGDWVMVETLPNEMRSVIHAVLPRRTAMARKVAGSLVDEQIIGANMDYLFITNALNQDFNLRKIERYLIAAWESGAIPVILLTKADLCDDPDIYISQVQHAAPGVPVLLVSALTEWGKEGLSPYLQPGLTIAVTGSSGVGKSTFLNWLAEDQLQLVQGIREDDARGRHTTTHRELFLLPCGALIMDTPGMRELQLWDAHDGWQQAFADIQELAEHCRYRDCQHERDPGCAVIEALNNGTLDARRLANYRKTEKELARLARKDSRAQHKQARNANDSRARTKKPKHRQHFAVEEFE